MSESKKYVFRLSTWDFFQPYWFEITEQLGISWSLPGCIASYSGDLEAYQQVSLKLKLGVLEDEYIVKKNSISLRSKESSADTDMAEQVKTGLHNPHCIRNTRGISYLWRIIELYIHVCAFELRPVLNPKKRKKEKTEASKHYLWKNDLCPMAFVFSVTLVFKWYAISSVQAKFQSDCIFAVLLKILMS